MPSELRGWPLRPVDIRSGAVLPPSPYDPADANLMPPGGHLKFFLRLGLAYAVEKWITRPPERPQWRVLLEGSFFRAKYDEWLLKRDIMRGEAALKSRVISSIDRIYLEMIRNKAEED